MRTYIFSDKCALWVILALGVHLFNSILLNKNFRKEKKQGHNAVPIRLFSFAGKPPQQGKSPLRKSNFICMLFPNAFVTKLGVTCFKCVCNKVGVEQLHSVTILTLMAVRDGEGGTSGEIVSRRNFSLKMITRMR